MTASRPVLPVARVVEQFNVSRSTLRRGLATGRFPNAFQEDATGRWMIPVEDLIGARIGPRQTWLNEPPHEPPDELVHDGSNPLDPLSEKVATEHAQLMNQLVHERAQVEKLTALLEPERDHVNSLKMALRMLEGPSPVAQHSPHLDPSHPHQTRHGFLSRLFKEPP